MKTKLFIVMLLMPLILGCSKDSDAIVGDWYSDSSDPEAYQLTEYTKEHTIGVISYSSNGKGVSKSLDEDSQSVMSEIKFHWTLSKDKLTIKPDGTNQSSTSNIIFEGDSRYYTVVQDETVTEKIVWQRM